MKINRYTPDQQLFLRRTSGIAKVPKCLYVIGLLPESDVTAVAIVGTRKPTSYGRAVTEMVAGELARRGVVIVSGLAIGIDGIAHQAALDASGTTIAILPTGLDAIHPRSHRQLSEQIIETGGALITEYPPGSYTMQHQFLERNRLVSALSDAVIVTEAALRSGTMSTVSHALEQGRTVFAVPGNINSPMSAGCNQLIRQGAVPLTSVDDVFLELGITAPSRQLILGDNDHENNILSLIKSGIQDGDELLQASGLGSSDFSQTMTMLEIKTAIQPLGANKWST